jgi:hypothetical protein
LTDVNPVPPLIDLADHGGDWPRYIDAVYAQYLTDLGGRKVAFRGRPVVLRVHPEVDGKGSGFWHCTSEGSLEADRVPDLDRCKRIAWIRPVIENEAAESVQYWVEKRGGQVDHILWFREEYVVILSERGTRSDGGPDAYLLKTAFCTLRPHEKRKKRQACETAKKANAAPRGTASNTPSTHGG